MSETKTWFITGASRGLGLALTRTALDAGHRVVAVSRSGTAGEAHERLSTHALDVRDRTACRDTVARAVREGGRIDVLVNNAGHGLVGAAEEVGESEAREILDVDLLGPLWLTQAVLPVMRSQRSGHVVQVSSVGGVGSMPFLGLYNAAKWGLEGFSEALAGEVRPFGIRVTLAEIGGMDTAWGTGGMQFASPLAEYDAVREQVLGSASVPWDVAPGATSGGTDPWAIARELLDLVGDEDDERLRVLLGEDAPGQVAQVLGMRLDDYARDRRFSLGEDGRTSAQSRRSP
ncbi:SDR family NAD(P)-dependent oxidoreductase [Nocardioides hwasunensis]|uniref:SDR family NAD(P)-dependent oxidoreductase n=1 Tax=Nocardioides hwasunensis TaxID=397258 RepID=A0ABR8MGJ6_9ACTN|nr:SDR family NAD(P)-dependent oxidoreductase [Nocardioides hwasunensis]MBD3913234.1 SDR family NAD(P)-dependent oxidoreductase [Nocardioides hwasunensis]